MSYEYVICDWCKIKVHYDTERFTEEEALKEHKFRKTTDPFYEFFCAFHHRKFLKDLELPKEVTTG